VFCDNPHGDTFEVPQRAKRKTGNELPNAPLHLWRGFEDGIDGGDGVPLLAARSEAFTKHSSSTSICKTFVLCLDGVLQTGIRNIGLSGGWWR
jgi:hypothetical protein